jgi:hypothetical protein
MDWYIIITPDEGDLDWWFRIVSVEEGTEPTLGYQESIWRGPVHSRELLREEELTPEPIYVEPWSQDLEQEIKTWEHSQNY